MPGGGILPHRISRMTLDRVLLALVVAALCLAGPVPAGHAARDTAQTELSATSDGLRLVVIEAPGCIYCGLFRRDVLPRYQTSARAKELPLSFLDINNEEADRLSLTAPIQIVPTVLLLKAHKEVGRIPGYVGPENFFHSVNHLLGSTAAH